MPQVEEGLEGEMKAGDCIRSSVRNPGKGTKTGQDSDSEIKEEVPM